MEGFEMTAVESIQWAPYDKECEICGGWFEGTWAQESCSPQCRRKFSARFRHLTMQQRMELGQKMIDELGSTYHRAPISELKLDFAEHGGAGAEDELRRRGYGHWVDRCQQFRQLQIDKGGSRIVTIAALTAWCGE
jgi:hypothetical protein